MSITGTLCRTNTASNTAFRGFGAPQAIVAAEDMIDRLAVKLGMDANAVRRLKI